MTDEFVPNLITFQTTLYVNVWDSPADEGANQVHLIDRFAIVIPGTVSNCVDQSNSLTVQGLHGIGNLTLAYFNVTTFVQLSMQLSLHSVPVHQFLQIRSMIT